MPYLNRTYRVADGERIEGSWRHVFIKNGDTYFLTALMVYADGMIDCWGLVDLAIFRQKVAKGWVATHYVQGGHASAHLLASWRFDQPEAWITAHDLIAEVADEIEHLAGRPTSEDRCLAAVDRFLDTPTEDHRTAAREAYLAVPAHLRVFLLGDMDYRDTPIRALITPVGEVLDDGTDLSDDEVVQASDHNAALEYFRERREELRQRRVTPPPWEDDAVVSDPSIVSFGAHDGGRPFLANGYPAPIELEEGAFPTVEHAYWALATTDAARRQKIASTANWREARAIGERAPHPADLNVVRLAVMLRLVREKFRQHPDLAAQLIATGDARILNSVDVSGGRSRFWSTFGHGRNWLGRILELVRAELRLSAADADTGAPSPS